MSKEKYWRLIAIFSIAQDMLHEGLSERFVQDIVVAAFAQTEVYALLLAWSDSHTDSERSTILYDLVEFAKTKPSRGKK